VKSLKIAAGRARRWNGETPYHAQRRHARANSVLSRGLMEDRSRARPRELLVFLRRAEKHEPDFQELRGNRRSIDLDRLRFWHRWRS
jgi:hypothetical protein